MSKPTLDQESRLQQQYQRLGTQNPVCLNCGESSPFCLELHHLAGRKHHDDKAIVCRNCHRKLSDQQHDHVLDSETKAQGPLAMIGLYLIGLADFLLMIVNSLREFGKQLIEEALSHVSA